MRLGRRQFTIFHLIVVIAICAVCFTVLREPFGWAILLIGAMLLILPVVGVLPGYFRGRSRGGSAILAGAASESIFLTLIFMVLLLYAASSRSFSIDSIVWICPLACLMAVFSFLLGLVISFGLHVFIKLTRHLFEPDSNNQPIDEIRWLHDDNEKTHWIPDDRPDIRWTHDGSQKI